MRDYWGYFNPADPVDYLMTVHSWDTAHGKKKTNDRSARGTFKLFRREDDGKVCAHLVDVWVDKVEFPQLKRQAQSDLNKDQPGKVLIDAKASGKDLIPALVEIYGEDRIVPVEPEADKVKRAENQVDQVEDKRLLLPNDGREFVKPYIDELANFPTGRHDDRVDFTTQFLKWMRETFVDQTPVSRVITNRPRKTSRF